MIVSRLFDFAQFSAMVSTPIAPPLTIAPQELGLMYLDICRFFIDLDPQIKTIGFVVLCGTVYHHIINKYAAERIAQKPITRIIPIIGLVIKQIIITPTTRRKRQKIPTDTPTKALFTKKSFSSHTSCK